MYLPIETVWRMSAKELIDLLNSGELAPKPKKVLFYVPSFMYYKTTYYRSSQFHFPTLSLTGTSCALDCKHCGAKVLETMQPAETPEKLFALASKLKHHGALGCLLSGGCLPDGSVPLGQFIPTIEKIKRELNLTIFVHTGIIDLDTAIELKKAGIDAALIDVIGSEETAKRIYGLNVTADHFVASLNALQEAGLNFVPHIIVGLHDGKLKNELDTLKIISSVRPSALVVIAFMPLLGTAMANVNPPQPIDIAKVIATARLMFPRTPMVLGCVRPKGKHRTKTEVLALKAGVNALAFPSEKVIEYAKANSYKFSFSSHCCAQIYTEAIFRNPSN